MTIEERIAAAQRRPSEAPTPEDLRAIAAAEAEGVENAIPLDDFMAELDAASGRLLLRIPKSLHKRLKLEAKAEGVSLNQYATYKLAR